MLHEEIVDVEREGAFEQRNLDPLGQEVLTAERALVFPRTQALHHHHPIRLQLHQRKSNKIWWNSEHLQESFTFERHSSEHTWSPLICLACDHGHLVALAADLRSQIIAADLALFFDGGLLAELLLLCKLPAVLFVEEVGESLELLVEAEVD